MITLIENGEIYALEPLGKSSILLVGNQIPNAGEFERSAVKSLGVDYEVIRAGEIAFKEAFLQDSNRNIKLVGE
ncbi:MAG TPA: hypothetical protein VK892_14515 [Pyrinomonadaceae bacterium]|nr:hypothetical protein [Pyrinomonadaceae bacterium]